MVFFLSALWWRRIRGVWKLLDGRDWLRGKLGLFLVVWAILNKSWIQFSVDGWGCVFSLLFDQRPSYGGGNEDHGDLLQKVPCTHSCTQYPQPCSRPPLTHTSVRDSWTLMGKSESLSCGSLLLSPWSWGTQGAHTNTLLFVPSKSLFPQSFVSSGGFMVGLMATSSKRAYATPRSTAPRAPAAVHCRPIPLQERVKHNLAQVLWRVWVLVCTTIVWALWVSLASMEFDFKGDVAPPTVSLGLLLCPWMCGIFFWWDPTFSCWWLFSSKL